jgi:hypothetical protein
VLGASRTPPSRSLATDPFPIELTRADRAALRTSRPSSRRVLLASLVAGALAEAAWLIAFEVAGRRAGGYRTPKIGFVALQIC